MATKKQKRLAAKAKHEAFMESIRVSGLEAQRKDREDRERQARMREEQAEADRRAKTSREATNKMKPKEK